MGRERERGDEKDEQRAFFLMIQLMLQQEKSVTNLKDRTGCIASMQPDSLTTELDYHASTQSGTLTTELDCKHIKKSQTSLLDS